MTTPDFEHLIGRLEGVRRRSNGAMARCPAHDDRNPSLSITISAAGKILWHCHAGCGQDRVTEALRAIGALPPADGADGSKPVVDPETLARLKKRAAAERAKAQRPATAADDTLTNRLWRTAIAVTGTPGAVYLIDRGVIESGSAHPEVRWIAIEQAIRQEAEPRPGRGAAGLILYRCAAPFDEPSACGACQMEAVTRTGRRIAFWQGTGRISAVGSDFAEGRRVFLARRDDAADTVRVCEGPLDALSLNAAMEVRASMKRPLKRSSIVGVPGLGHANAAAFAEMAKKRGQTICLAFDNDVEGMKAIERLTTELSAKGVKTEDGRPERRYKDWNDWIRDRRRPDPATSRR